MGQRLFCHCLLLGLVGACGVDEGEIATGKEVESHKQATADLAAVTTNYCLALSPVSDVVVGEKFRVTATLNDCAGQVVDSDLAPVEMTLTISDGATYRQLAMVKTTSGRARFYVLMRKAGHNYVLRAAARIDGETLVAESTPFNAPHADQPTTQIR